MKTTELLNTDGHRPWPLPTEPWTFYQEWKHVLFLHWQVEPADLKKFIPAHIALDLFEGKAWVSLVIFSMENVRPPYLPPWSFVSNFQEINIRTYIRHQHKTGVYFLSIEAGSALSCFIARTVSGLPYRPSRIQRNNNRVSSANDQYGDSLSVAYEPGQALRHKTQLDTWLTERYALVQDKGNSSNAFEIHHPEWPIYEVNLKELQLNYPRFRPLLLKAPDLLHYSPGVPVLTWGKKTIRTEKH